MNNDEKRCSDEEMDALIEELARDKKTVDFINEVLRNTTIFVVDDRRFDKRKKIGP